LVRTYRLKVVLMGMPLAVHLRGRRLIGRLALLGGLAGGCGDAGEEAWPTQLGDYAFAAGPAGAAQNVPSRAQAQLALSSALGSSPMYRPMLGEHEGELAEVLELDVSITEAGDHGGSWMVALELDSPELMRNRGAPEAFEVVLLVDLRPELDAEAASALALQSALGRGLSVLDAKSRLSLGTAEQASKLLGMPDTELRLLALNWIGTQGGSSDAAAVEPLLRDRDPRIVEAALFALSRVGSSAHTTALIALSLSADGSIARQAYIALGEVGGVRARTYLEFAARNEDEPRRRRAAELALRSTKRAGEPATWGEETSRSHRR
jgi:hypothetical protein